MSSIFSQLRARALPLPFSPDQPLPKAFAALFTNLPAKISSKRVAVAVSGGPDSLALLATAVQYLGSDRVTAITIDHQLDSGGEDPQRVQQLLLNHFPEVELITRRIEWPNATPPRIPRWLVRAREERYKLLGEECEKRQISLLLVGHNLDDDLGTMLYRMGHASGLDGMGGMKQLAPLPLLSPLAGRLDDGAEAAVGVFLARPFLSLPKTALIDACQNCFGHALFDPSNASPQFHRNNIISTLRTLSPNISFRLVHLLETFKKARSLLNSQMAALMRSCVILDRPSGNCTLVLNSPRLLQPSNKPLLLRTINTLLQYSAAVHRPMHAQRLNQLYQQLQQAYQQNQAVVERKRALLPFKYQHAPAAPIDQTLRIKSVSVALGGGIIYPLSRLHTLKRISLHNQRFPQRPIQYGPGFLIQSERSGQKLTLEDLLPTPHSWLLYDQRVYLRPRQAVDSAALKWSVEPLDVDRVHLFEACTRKDYKSRLPLQLLLSTTPMTHTYHLPVLIAEKRGTGEVEYICIPSIKAVWARDPGMKSIEWEVLHAGESVLSNRFLCAGF